ncbi:hypothetical protein K431DRAFT_6675 [Polychaeton citri CBS 116435]|uniref:Uncharacterized protein n=1 Tax=Polychaeton citri CBS 116435 TaxID=1314669 RepID=A0A9P4QFI4_9PEZI|nr:hypothetical protein K431DRAFT_6675 [Polychaeton citri CBS 116435]
MEKLKKVFTPGKAQDDEVMYGTSASAQTDPYKASKTDSTSNSKDTYGADSQLQQDTAEGPHKQSLSQQPRQSEYSGTQHSSGTGAVDSTTSASNQPEKKEHGVLRQILNPGGEKYDQVAYGAPASQQQAEKDTTSQQHYDTVTDPTASREPATAASGLRQENVDSDSASTIALKSGIPGPYSESRSQSLAEPEAQRSGEKYVHAPAPGPENRVCTREP